MAKATLKAGGPVRVHGSHEVHIGRWKAGAAMGYTLCNLRERPIRRLLGETVTCADCLHNSEVGTTVVPFVGPEAEEEG